MLVIYWIYTCCNILAKCGLMDGWIRTLVHSYYQFSPPYIFYPNLPMFFDTDIILQICIYRRVILTCVNTTVAFQKTNLYYVI